MKAIQILARQAKRYGVVLRQSHARLAKAAAVRAGRYAHARQFRRMRRELKRLRTYLGRVFRDISRKIAGNGELEARLARCSGWSSGCWPEAEGQEQALFDACAP